tara:strand:- start:378 stop:572 length:195 start_codon:yes stop_codon:yes gene_type:complete
MSYRYNDKLEDVEDHEVLVGVIGKIIEVLPVDEVSITAVVNGKIIRCDLEDDGGVSVAVISDNG